MPRHVIDSKNPAGSDMPFVVKMDGNRISGEPMAYVLDHVLISTTLSKNSKHKYGQSIDYCIWARAGL